MISSFLVIAFSPNRGRGVFTKKNIKKGTVIEVSPVIVLNETERKTVEKTSCFITFLNGEKIEKKPASHLGMFQCITIAMMLTANMKWNFPKCK